MAEQKKLQVMIRNFGGVVFEGDAFAVSSTNDRGPFDILEEHANFISLIKEKLVIHHHGGKNTEYSIESGILYCTTSQVQIYLGIETPA